MIDFEKTKFLSVISFSVGKNFYEKKKERHLEVWKS